LTIRLYSERAGEYVRATRLRGTALGGSE